MLNGTRASWIVVLAINRQINGNKIALLTFNSASLKFTDEMVISIGIGCKLNFNLI